MGCCTSKTGHHLHNRLNQPMANGTVPQPTPIDNSQSARRNQHIRQMQKPAEMNGTRISEKERVDTPIMTESNQGAMSHRGAYGNNNLGQQQYNGIQVYNSNMKQQDASYLQQNGGISYSINGKQIIVDNVQNNVRHKKKRVKQYFDISPKLLRKHQIYQLTNNFPVQQPYSNLSDWQKIVSKNQQMTEEELITKILQLRNRNWIQEQIKLQTEINYQGAASFESLITVRKSIQLREHFNWFVWALAQYYFQQKIEDNSFNLPKVNTKKWTEGFEYKGLYVRVLPYEDAYFIQNEILALKYVLTELQELNSMAPQILQQYGNIKENLHKDVIMSLITGMSCGGFYIYATPMIYTQELDNIYFKDQGLNSSKIFIGHNSSVYNHQNSMQMQAILNQSNASFSYLHNNISPEFIQDSLFKFMPVLKNITTQNMIPIIDFEDYNQKPDDQKDDTELKYYLINLFDMLPHLSDSKASMRLVRFPCFINDEITFHDFPSNNLIELSELRSMINSQSELDINADDDDEQSAADQINTFTKRYLTKHGWDFLLMQRKGITNENKRASAFYMAREIQLIKKQAPEPKSQQNNNILLIDDYKSKDNSIYEEQKVPSKYLSPHKQSIFKRTDTSMEKDSKVCGNILLSAYNYRKDFKIKYSLNNHTLSTNIEQFFSASLDQVVKIMEQSDNIYNSQSIKELFHRKGLNLRFQWVALAKLRQNNMRDQVMIDILLRVMRKIINEEIKMKAFTQHPVPSESGPVLEEYYQGSQIDVYKEYITTFMNAILKKKIQKNKQVFDEALLGLFLSRMSIIGMIYQLNLRKEEFFYIESKDILEDIIEAPSRNPTYFINAVQNYFKIEFKPEILKLVRQDKHLFLSKSLPVTKNEVKQIQLRVHSYQTLREQAYFLLARQISNASGKDSPSKKIASKVKTKSEKDKLKQSFQKPNGNASTVINNSFALNSARSRVNQSGIGPTGIMNNQQDSILDNQETKTNRRQPGQNIQSKESLSTIRQYHNMDKAILNDSAEFGSPPINQAKLKTVQNVNEQQSSMHLDFSKLSKRNNFKPSQTTEIIFPSILYKLKTFLSNNPMYYFDDSSKTYIGDTLTIFKSFYEMPSLELVDEWVMILESQLKDVFSIYGGEQILLEAFLYQALLIYFYRNDQEELFKVLTKIKDMVVTIPYIAPELLILIQILVGIYFEEQKDQHPMEAEKNYLIAMICILHQYGDPRGRGNITIPYSLYLSWKLSLISLAEDKKLHDSEYAEELFDASLRCLFNHKRVYKEQQLRAAMLTSKNLKQQQDVPPPLSQFEIELDKAELEKQLFDIKKYRSKPFNLTYASGVPKSNTILLQGKNVLSNNQKQFNNLSMLQTSKDRQEASVVYVSQNHNFNSDKNAVIQGKQRSKQQQNLTVVQDKSLFVEGTNLKSNSHIPQMKKKKTMKTNEYDIDPSEIDLEIEDENKSHFIEVNFKNNEWYIGECPFQHWSLYRQQVAQILQAHNPIIAKNNQAQQQYLKQIYKDIMQKFLPKDLFYQWILKFNPMMYQSGSQWSNESLRSLIFNNNQQMVSSSGSSAVMSSHNMSSSHQSLNSSSQPQSAKDKKNMHLGSYSQILGKEVGGINKQEMCGVLFSMGTDNNGQLGLDVMSLDDNNSHSSHPASVKVLYPRMIVSLRDEVIKEVCCGNSHTMVINISGQVFVWGANQTGQLGLGDIAPPIVRKPILNPHLQNITKLSAGYEHSIAINKQNELFIWGSGGLCGTGTLKQQNIPVKMDFFSKSKVLTAVCGGLHTVAVTKDTGETYSWGLTEGGQLGLPQASIVKLCQGQGDEPQVLTPQKIPKLEGLQIVQIACGEAHSIAMTKDGTLYGWGQSNYGQLGLGFSGDSFEPGLGMEKSKVYEPQEINGLKHERISKIICGATFTLFLTDKGDLYGCGVNDLGQLGLDTFMEEMQIASLEKVKKGKHNQTSDVILPTRVICFQGIAIHQVACGESHSLAVSGDSMNMLWAWGMYKNGQLGLGEVTMKLNPRPVQTLCSSQIQKVACGSMHSVVSIGDHNQVTTFSSQYYGNNESLKNYWLCDFKGLAKNAQQDNIASNSSRLGFYRNFLDDEVPDDGEGRVKNPK